MKIVIGLSVLIIGAVCFFSLPPSLMVFVVVLVAVKLIGD